MNFHKELFLNCWTEWKLSVKVSIVLLMMHLSNAIVSMKFEWFERIWTDREFWKVRDSSSSEMN